MSFEWFSTENKKWTYYVYKYDWCKQFMTTSDIVKLKTVFYIYQTEFEQVFTKGYFFMFVKSPLFNHDREYLVFKNTTMYEFGCIIRILGLIWEMKCVCWQTEEVQTELIKVFKTKR